MLQVVFVSLIIGIGLLQLSEDKAKPLLDVFESLTALVVRLVDLIMLMAPLGVFALIARTITGLAGRKHCLSASIVPPGTRGISDARRDYPRKLSHASPFCAM